MPLRFAKDDDPTEILQFSFLDQYGRVTKDSFKSACKPPYPAKYYINAFLTVSALTVFLLWNFGIIPGTKLGFFCKDPLFSHKYRGDTVSPTILGIGITLIFPLIYFTIEVIRQKRCRDVFTMQNFAEFYVYLKLFTFGLILVGGVTEIAKTIVGEHRPHFFDTCKPDTNMNCTEGTYIFDFTCTNKEISSLDQTDSSRSFPSGHSSLSWFTALFTAFIVQSRLPIHRTGSAVKLLMIGICLTFGLTCSLTRITDRRHHWWDVLIGTIIAFVGAAYSISLTSEQVKILHRKLVSEMEEGPDEVTKVEFYSV
ncbi:phospholipid phosphatase 1-like isoform X2 [Anthonomus grandis grandis]|nr:phospholipid phosphatase 1-like isoform X2 [Anthonomus grandis grandis]